MTVLQLYVQKNLVEELPIEFPPFMAPEIKESFVQNRMEY